MNLSLLKGYGDIFFVQDERKNKLEEVRGGCKLKLYPIFFFLFFFFFFNLVKDKRLDSFWVVNCQSRGGKKNNFILFIKKNCIST